MLLPYLTKINCNLYQKDLYNIFSCYYLCYLNREKTNLNSMASFFRCYINAVILSFKNA